MFLKRWYLGLAAIFVALPSFSTEKLNERSVYKKAIQCLDGAWEGIEYPAYKSLFHLESHSRVKIGDTYLYALVNRGDIYLFSRDIFRQARPKGKDFQEHEELAKPLLEDIYNQGDINSENRLEIENFLRSSKMILNVLHSAIELSSEEMAAGAGAFPSLIPIDVMFSLVLYYPKSDLREVARIERNTWPNRIKLAPVASQKQPSNYYLIDRPADIEAFLKTVVNYIADIIRYKSKNMFDEIRLPSADSTSKKVEEQIQLAKSMLKVCRPFLEDSLKLGYIEMGNFNRTIDYLTRFER